MAHPADVFLPPVLSADLRTIPLTKGYNALVDQDDYFQFGHLKWHTLITPRTSYAIRNQINPVTRVSESILLHRVINRTPGGLETHHKNHLGTDCRREYLESRTSLQNRMDRQKQTRVTSSRYKGVLRRKRGWRAQISVEGRTIYLGSFTREVDAARCYDEGSREYYGEYGCTNEDLYGQYWQEAKEGEDNRLLCSPV